ncbi:MAG TPA: response regulator transcription factor [Kofleriaceae bacterium]
MGRVATRQQIALIDDHALFREGLRAVLASDRLLDVVGDAATAREALELASRAAFDIAVLDVMLPDQPGAAVARELRRIQPRCRILVLSMVEVPYLVAEMLRAGAVGYALKSQPTDEILEAFHTVGSGRSYLAPRLPREQIDALVEGKPGGPVAQLTTREREVFELLIRGWSNERVAAALFIAVRTAETHRQNIMTKLGVHSIVELLRLAARHGLLGEDYA